MKNWFVTFELSLVFLTKVLLLLLYQINSCMDMFVDSSGSSNNHLYSLHGVTHNWSSGTLYIADYNKHRVMKYLSSASLGRFAGENGAGTGTTRLYYPVGLYFDSSSNNLLIAGYHA